RNAHRDDCRSWVAAPRRSVAPRTLAACGHGSASRARPRSRRAACSACPATANRRLLRQPTEARRRSRTPPLMLVVLDERLQTQQRAIPLLRDIVDIAPRVV